MNGAIFGFGITFKANVDALNETSEELSSVFGIGASAPFPWNEDRP